MTADLEQRVQSSSLRARMQDFGHRWKDFLKDLTLPYALQMPITVGVAWYAAERDVSPAIQTVALYAGYPAGYLGFFYNHYRRHREDYPGGMLSKKFGKFVIDFLGVDYMADPLASSPVMIGTSLYLNRVGVHPAASTFVAVTAANLTFSVAMTAAQPTFAKISSWTTRNVLKPSYEMARDYVMSPMYRGMKDGCMLIFETMTPKDSARTHDRAE